MTTTTSTAMLPKTLKHIQGSISNHWVGNGFPVRTLFSYSDLGKHLSPFLLLDYAGPKDFQPTEARLGVGEHPHLVLRLSPSFMTAKSSIAIRPVAVA